LTKSQEIALARRYQDYGDEDALQELIEANLRLVVWVCKRLSSWNHSKVPIEDLLALGNEQLFISARKWNPNGSAAFGAFARQFIERGVVRNAGKEENIIKVPLNVGEKLRKLKYNERILTQKLGRTPKIQELSKVTGFTTKKIRELKDIMLREPSSLDALSNLNMEDTDEN
jgi:RNA polymerase primary sigma factor